MDTLFLFDVLAGKIHHPDFPCPVAWSTATPAADGQSETAPCGCVRGLYDPVPMRGWVGPRVSTCDPCPEHIAWASPARDDDHE